jgi:hypothetical protein
VKPICTLLNITLNPEDPNESIKAIFKRAKARLRSLIDFDGDLPLREALDIDELKLEIERLDKIGEWEILKRTSNPYELVFSQSQDKRIPQSICNIKPLSRSFFKMIEILHILDFFKRTSVRKLTRAHVCDGPAGFIEALLFLSSRNSVTLEEASAMTLKPTKANIPGWKRAYHFLKTSPMVKIEYGADNTGDILVPLNQGSFLEKTRSRCNIFTADGGFESLGLPPLDADATSIPFK